jgi:microcystin-dependent protein
MKKIIVEGGGFPGTSKTWRHIAEMIQQTADVTTALAGDNVIVSGLGSTGPNSVSSGLVVIGGELFPVLAGSVNFGDAYISIVDDVEETQYLKDENGDGAGDLIDTYFDRYGVLTSSSAGNVKLSDLVRIKDIRELSKRIPPQQTALPYFGSVTSIPNGWQLCNGTNGTPDLRGKFVVGLDQESDDYESIGDTGGEASHTLSEQEMPQHTHSGSTNSAGSHSHSGTAAGPYDGTPIGGGFDGGGNAFRARPISLNSAGSHSHSVSIGSKGGSQSHENRPPYYTLAYITYTGF